MKALPTDPGHGANLITPIPDLLLRAPAALNTNSRLQTVCEPRSMVGLANSYSSFKTHLSCPGQPSWSPCKTKYSLLIALFIPTYLRDATPRSMYITAHCPLCLYCDIPASCQHPGSLAPCLEMNGWNILTSLCWVSDGSIKGNWPSPEVVLPPLHFPFPATQQ